jgi:hypothetical protein
MKTINNFKKRLCLPSSLNKLKKSLAFSALILAGTQNSILAQTDSIVKPSWYFGVVGGANFNFYEGSTQKLNNDLTVPSVFHKGDGVGLFLGPLIEFHRPESRWGVMLQGGYDSRKGTFKQILTPCNCPTDLTANLNYITVEPSLRFAPFKSNLYLYLGPRFAYNLDKSFTYHQNTNPAYPEQTPNPEILC